MAIRDTWRRALEYFGLVEGDYIEEGEYDEGDTGTELALDETAAPRGPVRSLPSRRRGREDDIADIFGDVFGDIFGGGARGRETFGSGPPSACDG